MQRTDFYSPPKMKTIVTNGCAFSIGSSLEWMKKMKMSLYTKTKIMRMKKVNRQRRKKKRINNNK